MAAATTHLNREHSHLPFLDGLRGFLSLWVVMGHVAFAVGLTIPIISEPQKAVDVFMFVSGFLMAYYFRIREDKEPWHSPATWRMFYIRRFFRIAPAFYLCMVLIYGLAPWFQAELNVLLARYSPGEAAYQAAVFAPVDWIDVLTHFTFTFGFFPRYSANNWSIGLEMQFYMALPFIMLLYRRAGYIASTALLIALWAAANHFIGDYAGGPHKLLNFLQPVFLPLRINQFVVGILLAESYFFKGRASRKSMLLFLAAVVLALATSSKILAAVVCLAALLLIFPAESAPRGVRKLLGWMQAAFDSRPCRFLADTSYSVYLFHVLLIVPMAAWWISHPAFLPLPPREKFPVFLLAVALIVYPAAYLVYRFIERPGITLGKQLIRHRRTAAPAPITPAAEIRQPDAAA